jgi:hypothetical protein
MQCIAKGANTLAYKLTGKTWNCLTKSDRQMQIAKLYAVAISDTVHKQLNGHTTRQINDGVWYRMGLSRTFIPNNCP